jgi:hypothetical protein
MLDKKGKIVYNKKAVKSIDSRFSRKGNEKDLYPACRGGDYLSF